MNTRFLASLGFVVCPPGCFGLGLEVGYWQPSPKNTENWKPRKNHTKIKRNLFFFSQLLSCSVVLYSLFKEHRTPHIISVYRCIVFSQYIPMPEPIIDTKSMLISITIAWRMYLPSTLCPVPGNSHVNCLINASINKKKYWNSDRDRKRRRERQLCLTDVLCINIYNLCLFSQSQRGSPKC